LLSVFPCLALLGPRQVGKTTFSKYLQEVTNKEILYLDLESLEDEKKLENAEQYFNERQGKLIILDEIQRRPDLFPLLRSVIDKKKVPARFILLGSASPELLAKSSETLAGRVAYKEMHPFCYTEIKEQHSFQKLWLRGGFPEFFLQEDDDISFEMRQQFIQTYLERELPLLGLSVSPVLLRNLLRMLAAIHGQAVNYSKLGSALGVQVNTIKRYLDYFENAFLIRRLYPFYVNVKKRLVKAPKIYIRDTGLLHTLSGMHNYEDMEANIDKGNSWESFVLQQIIPVLKSTIEYYYYRTHDGTELDVVFVRGGVPFLGLEIKLSNAHNITKGTTIASQDLGDIPVLVITHSVQEDYMHNAKVRVTSFERMFFWLGEYGVVE
jgi:predicted AAA+ superfamily ATPase